jgi:hypothetical protein
VQDADDIERMLMDLILSDLDDEQFCRGAEEILEVLREHDREISLAFQELLDEVDELILLAEQLEEENLHSG